MSKKRTIVIFGATSSIAQATARLLAQEGAHIVLVARNAERLEMVSNDLAVRGASQVDKWVADLSNTEDHAELIAAITKSVGRADIALIAYGMLGDQHRAEKDFTHANDIVQTNFASAVSLLHAISDWFVASCTGTIVVLSSVAGDRGRQSNYVYGAAKAGLTVFLQGLRNRLFRQGVRVITIKPGMVDTPMTSHLRKGLLSTKPHRIAQGIVTAIEKKRHTVYLPGFWRPIMFVIRHIPEIIFKRLKL